MWLSSWRWYFMENYNPNRLKELAKQKNILEVAHSLGMELIREGRNYCWAEHKSFKINPERNYFSWFSKGNEFLGQDVIKMVEVVNHMSFKEALKYLLEAEVGAFDVSKVPKKKPFIYNVKEVKRFDYARKFLKEERGLSDDTIDFFLSKKIMTQAIHKDYETGKTEPMIVFKHFDMDGNIIGGVRQGIWYNKTLYPEKGRLKRTLPNSDGSSGVIVDIGERANFRKATPDKPFTVFAFEAPIDMMSYYELHKDKLSNCRLVAMNGLNKGIISRAVVEALAIDSAHLNRIAEKVSLKDWLDKIDEVNVKLGKSYTQLKIVLAVDNDEPKFDPKLARVITPGKDFFERFGLQDIKVIPHMPKCHTGQVKNDWNDELKYQKGLSKQQELTLENAINKTQVASHTIDTPILS